MKVMPDNLLIKQATHQVPHLSEWLAFIIRPSLQSIGIELLQVDEAANASDGSLINRVCFRIHLKSFPRVYSEIYRQSTMIFFETLLKNFKINLVR